MKKIIVSLSLFFSFTSIISCTEDTPVLTEIPQSSGSGTNTGTNPESTITHSGIITENETWSNTSIHLLEDKVVVESGAVLTIEAGTVIKGLASNDVEDASALIIAKGGRIQAIGTSSDPIIFTAEDDAILADQTYPNGAPNLSAADVGLWGGLIILGNARCSFKKDVEELQIEGIPAEDTFGLYGGTNDADDSGILRYVSIRHGGTNIGAGNEINGLTLGGVGAGTTLSHIEVYANQDDGIEFFGGNVNLSNALVWSQGDDAYDIDQAYSGNISNIVYIAGDESDHALEIDGREGAALTPASRNQFTIANATFKGPGITASGREMVDWRSNAEGAVTNSYFFNFGTDADVEIDGDGTKYLSVTSGSSKEVGDKVSNNPTLYDNYRNGSIIFSGNEFKNDIGKAYNSIFAIKWSVAPSATSDSNGTFDANDTDDNRDPNAAPTATEIGTQETRLQTENNSVATKSANVGADTSLLGWTLAFDTGVLDF